MRPVAPLLVFLGTLLGAWMAGSTLLLGLGSDLNWWYLPIGVAYVIVSLIAAGYVRKTARNGFPLHRLTSVFAAMSWICALAFGITVPGRNGDRLDSLLSLWLGGDVWREISIALCNPFAILAFACAITAAAFAAVSSREPRPEEDEGMDEVRMVEHPLHGRV